MTKEEEKEFINLWKNKTKNQKLFHDTGGKVISILKQNNEMIVETDMWSRMPTELLDLGAFYWVNTIKTTSRIYTSCITINAAHKTLIDFQTIINSGFLTFINFDSLLQELDTQYEITLIFYNNNLINVEPNARRKI